MCIFQLMGQNKFKLNNYIKMVFILLWMNSKRGTWKHKGKNLVEDKKKKN